MPWEVEYTDEFEEWWNSLTENEQSEVQASVKLLSALGRASSFRILRASRSPSIRGCGNYERNVRGDRFERSMPLIRVVSPS